MSEASLVKNILKRLNGIPGCRAQKTHGGKYGTKGKPDITGCFYGIRFEMEVKRPGEKPDPLQQHEMDQWSNVGAFVKTVHSVEEALNLIGTMNYLATKITSRAAQSWKGHVN